MQLRYDYSTRRFLGKRYSIDEETFLRALQALLRAGCEPDDALRLVLDEATWSTDTPGVSPLPAHAVCRRCGRSLPWCRQAYCDVVCEAVEAAEAVW